MNDADKIEFYRDWVRRLLTGLFSLAGFAPGGVAVARLPGSAQRQIRRHLLPLESVARRLIFLAERHLAETPVPQPKPGPSIAEQSTLGYLSRNRRKKKRKRPAKPDQMRAAVFWLFDKKIYQPHKADPHRRPPRGVSFPRMSFFDGSDPLPLPVVEKPPRDEDDARKLTRRLQALFGALEDVPGQALRLRLLLERRKNAPIKSAQPLTPIRDGSPPGFRYDGKGEAFELLRACHAMASEVNAPPND